MLLKGVVCLLVAHVLYAQISKIAADDQMKKSKFSSRDAVSVENIIFSQDVNNFHPKSLCKHNIDVAWNTEVGSSIYQTPIIADLHADGNKEVIIPTFVKFLEVLNGDNGEQHTEKRWPFVHPKLISHSSSTLYDINGDGVREVVLYTADAEIVFLTPFGEPLSEYTIKIAPLKVDKYWYKGLVERDDIDVHYSLHKEPQVKDPPKKSGQGHRKLAQVEEEGNSVRELEVEAGTEGWLSKEAKDSLKLIYGQSVADDSDDSIFHPASYDTELAQRKEQDKKLSKKEFVYVDAHLLSTPVIVDIDKDGVDDMIMAVSYFYDREYYADSQNIHKLDDDVNISNYVAGGLVAINLKTRKVKWEIHLDMTTDHTRQRAHIYAPPTVVDIDGDGHLDIVIGTSLGWIYVVNDQGQVSAPGFPVLMGEIQGQVIVEDINGDGELEICAVDYNSNFACFDYKGKEIWERTLTGSSAQAPTIADIDGDGTLDLVIGTSTGAIYAVRGDNGKDLSNFPIKTSGPIYSPALIMKMNQTKNSGLTVILPSFDGYLYLIDGKTGCLDKIDIGEKVYSQVLASDLTGNGKLDLVVTTMNGNVYNFGTQVETHPLRSQETQYLTSWVYREDYHGIYAVPESRRYHDVIGSEMSIEFEIIDKRKMPSHMPRSYDVTIKVNAKNSIPEPFIRRYDKPGRYVAVVQVPSAPFSRATVMIQMINDRGQFFTDEFPVMVNFGFLNLFKWVVVVPFTACAVVILFTFGQKQVQLPT